MVADELAAATPPHIGSLNEKPLHAALKEWYAQPGDRFEAEIDGYIIDIVRGELLIEIQTSGFASIKRKLSKLTSRHHLRLVYPVARDRWIVKLNRDERRVLSRRKSPKKGSLEEVFWELVSFPHLLRSPSFSIDVVLVQEEQLRRHDEQRGWRRGGWVVLERRLLTVLDHRLFETPDDMGSLLPEALAEPFTTFDLAVALSLRQRLAQRMAYCLREMGVLTPVGKQGNAILYARAREGI